MEYAVVAFLDILGFSRMVRSDAVTGNARFLNVFQHGIEVVRKQTHSAGLDVRMFSDSIIIAAPLTPKNVTEIIRTTAQLQRSFCTQQVLLRGGVAFGKHFSTDAILFSEALINAYLLERDIARYPRIVVGKDLLDYVLPHRDSDETLRATVQGLLLRDRDGACFVHFLQKSEFTMVSPDIQKYLSTQQLEGESVLEKMRWLHDYHNYCAERYGQVSMSINGLSADFTEVK